MLAALVVGLALLLMLTNPGSQLQPAQAQTTTAPKTELTTNGNPGTSFNKVDGATSSITLPRADGTAANLQPIRIVLERTVDGDKSMNDWHQLSRTQTTGYKKDATLVFYDGSNQPKLRLWLENAWPAEYQVEQRGSRMVERVTLTADYFDANHVELPN